MFSRSPEETRREFARDALPHADALYNFAVKMTRNGRDAEDLVQDTFLRAFRFFHRFQSGTNIRAWLFRILKNTYINNYRKIQRTPDQVEWGLLEEFYDSVAPDHLLRRHKNPEEILLEGSVDGRIEEAIRQLPEEYRAVVLLNFVEEMSYKEIASILEVPMGTVMSRLHRGRKMLQQSLGGERHEVGPATPEPRASRNKGQVVSIHRFRRQATGS